MPLIMRVCVLAVLVSVALPHGTHAATSLRSESKTVSATADHVEQLISQLGNDDFGVRREAESQLIQLGAAAFDYLEDAQNHPDLEIATQSQYLLHRVLIDWTRADDPQEVRDLVSNYSRVNERERKRIVIALAKLENSAGLPALSRIAHYDLDQSTAKLAALMVLSGRVRHQSRASEIARQIEQEIGNSPRDTAQWLRLFIHQLLDPDTINAGWNALIESEKTALMEGTGASSTSVVLALMQFHISLCRDIGSPQELFEALQGKIDFLNGKPPNADGTTPLVQSRLLDLRQDEIVDLGSRRSLQAVNDDLLLIHVARRDHGSSNGPLALALASVVEQQEWRVLALLEEHYADTIKNDRLLLYLSAIGRAARKETDEAADMAARAYALVAQDIEDRSRLADVLAEYGYHNWAEREWRFVVEKVPVKSLESMIARRALANWCLHDRGEDKEASELLGEVCDAFDQDKKDGLADDTFGLYLRELRTQRDYFLACHMEKVGDFSAQRRYLDSANRRNPEDPDVLIAMYRLKNPDEHYREKVVNRIARAVALVEQRIESEPGEPTWYNHYAWLVSNTQGDYEKAVRYSHKSLELRPDTPSYLDTLGRCYFAAGDYENAIKYQRRAVEMHPEVQVMRRQLESFEKALAEGKK